MTKQEDNFLRSLKNYRADDIVEAIYFHDLPLMIEEEIYKKSKKAIKNNWKLGCIHYEWWDFLRKYFVICIKAPRGHLKTFFFSEAYSLHQARFKDGIKIHIFSKSDALAIEILSHIKAWASLPFFKKLLGGADLDNKTQIRFGNKSEIFASGFWSNIRGGHRDIIVLDDIIDTQVIYSDEQNKKSKERLASEIIPMLNPDGQLIVIGTLQREDDIYSVDWEEVIGGGDKKCISKTYDAIVDEEKKITLFPERWSWERLMEEKRRITILSGEKWFLKEYRNMAVNLVGEIIKPEWIQYYDRLPSQLEIYCGWDLAVGEKEGEGDYTAGVVFGVDRRGNIYIIRAYRDRIDFPTRLRKIVEIARAEKPKLIQIENNVFQADTVQTLIRNTALTIRGVKTTKNKIKKYNEELAPLFENRKVYFKRDDLEQKIMINELLSLPRGAHDDFADALCIGLKGISLEINVKNLIFEI